MNNYDKIKDIILIKDDILGDITLDELLFIIELLLEDNIKFEEVISNILYKNKANSSIANEIMNIPSTDMIKFYINLIKNRI